VLAFEDMNSPNILVVRYIPYWLTGSRIFIAEPQINKHNLNEISQLPDKVIKMQCELYPKRQKTKLIKY
jgi:hypothetical protein